MAKRGFGIVMILAVLVGAFLLLDGIAGLMKADSLVGQISGAFNKSGRTIAIVVAIIEVIAGALLVLGQFVSIGSLEPTLRVAIFIAWIVVMVLVLVIADFSPDKLAWWRSLLQYSILLAVIWMVKGDN